MNQQVVSPLGLIIAALVGILTVPVTGSTAVAQESAELEGSQLQPIATMDQEIGNAIGDLFGTKPDGEIGTVTVTQERAASLRLHVEYEGFEENWLKGHALRAGADGDPEQIEEIVVEAVELDGSGEAEIEFKLDEDVEEGASFESSHLVLFGAKRAYSRTGAEQTFVLQKRWDKATRAENIEVVVRANALQDDPSMANYTKAPEPGSRPDYGPADDEVSTERVRFTVGRRGEARRYLHADGGGGGSVRLQTSSGDETIFEIGWIDREAKIGRVYTANGWHLLAIRPNGRVDARSADRADPATVVHFKGGPDGTVILQAAEAATARRITGAAERSRLQIFSRPSISLRKSVPAQPALNLSPTDRAALAGLRNQTASSDAQRMTVTYDGGSQVTAVPFEETRTVNTVMGVERKNVPIPANIERPGDGEGPAPDPAFDLEGLPVMQGYISGRTADPGPRIEDLLGIDSQIWADRNEASGIFYFVPSAYHLRWDADDGYDLSLTDEMAGAEGSPHVLVRARLAPRFTPLQRRAAEVLVRQGARARGLPFFELRPMPIVRGATTDDATETLAGHHGIEQITVQPPNDAMGMVQISWRMPPVTRESFVELLRQDRAVAPQLLLQASGEGGTHRIPLYLSWAEPGSYPPFFWENNSFRRNEIPHPIRLKGLHTMVLNRDERVQVLSYDLSNTATIPSRARAAMHSPLTQSVLDKAFFTWVEYSVVPDDASIQSAVQAITGGVSEQVRQPLTITLFDPLASSGAQQLTVFVRSRYLEAGGDQPILRQFEFTADGEVREIPFYLGRADVEVPFEWTVRLRMPDGQEYERPVFLQGDNGLQLIVSSSSLREIFGELPPGGDE